MENKNRDGYYIKGEGNGGAKNMQNIKREK